MKSAGSIIKAVAPDGEVVVEGLQLWSVQLFRQYFIGIFGDFGETELLVDAGGFVVGGVGEEGGGEAASAVFDLFDGEGEGDVLAAFRGDDGGAGAAEGEG